MPGCPLMFSFRRVVRVSLRPGLSVRVVLCRPSAGSSPIPASTSRAFGEASRSASVSELVCPFRAHAAVVAKRDTALTCTGTGQNVVGSSSGGGGIRTRVLRSFNRPSPSAAGNGLSGAASLPAVVPPRIQLGVPSGSLTLC